MSAIYVDRAEGGRDAMWRVVGDAHRGGAVGSAILEMITLARDDFETGQWEGAEQLAEEAFRACEAHGTGA